MCENWDEKKYKDTVNISKPGCDNNLVGRNTKFSMLFEAKTDVLLQTLYFIISIPERTKGLKIKVILVKGSQKAHEYNMLLNIMFNFILLVNRKSPSKPSEKPIISSTCWMSSFCIEEIL